MPSGPKKIFVLDTNVILHDSSCIYQFDEHDVVVPITVLEELDNFKKGNETLNFHAREFVRAIDSLSGDRIFNEGVHIGSDKGKIIIKLEQEFHPDLAFGFRSFKADHYILNAAYFCAKQHSFDNVILVSKDVNLRMKAKSIGLMAQDYRTDHVTDVSSLYTGRRIEEGMSSSLINKMYNVESSIAGADLAVHTRLLANEFLIMRNGKKSALARYDSLTDTLRRVDKAIAYGIIPRNAEQTFALDALLNPNIKLVTIAGKAGTGKTLLALAGALETKKMYRQIYLARPVVPLSNKDIGFLPGDIHSKLDPYMQPLHDNLGVIQNQFPESGSKNKRIKELLESEKLKIAPLAYIRGRSLVQIYFIVDEAQNLTPHEIKTIITRAGEGTKMVFTGDIYQIDHPYLDSHSNGLSYLIEKMQGENIYAHVTLEKGERSELAELASNLL
jgi:PhoH-like ATPase